MQVAREVVAKLVTRFPYGAAALLAIAAALISGCESRDPHPGAASHAYPAAERLFRADARWLGADAALSIALSEERTLWLFGDSFVATSDARTRDESEMVRNSVAIQLGSDPATAAISFFWREAEGERPSAFFAAAGESWYWPGHGIRLDEGPLVIFLFEVVGTPGEGLGFATVGYALALVDNPDDAPDAWDVRVIEAPRNPFDAIPATAVVRDGDYVVAVAIRQEGVHAGTLVRFPAAALGRGELDTAEWWGGESRGWVSAAELSAQGPTFVIDDAGAECSLHLDSRTGLYVHVATYGFGDTTIGMRTAPALTGPWSNQVTVYRPPESDGPRPFVYAAKAHPQLTGDRTGELLVTYVASSFEFDDLLTPVGMETLYWPRFVAIRNR